MSVRDDTNYLEALKEVADQSKSSIGIASAPLAIVLVQLRYLSSVEAIWIKLIATGAVASLFVATVLAWIMANDVKITLALELYDRDGKKSEKGTAYRSFILRGNETTFSEDGAIEVAKRFVGKFWAFALIGYLLLFILVLGIIWQNPAHL